MQKAFDWVDRDLLLYKLINLGVSGKFYNVIKSIYAKSQSCIKLNNELYSDWFNNVTGVKQGDVLSPTLFSLFINDLAVELKRSNLGIPLGGDMCLSTLFYADDIVIMAENEKSLQSMLDIVTMWCKKWRLMINRDKSNVVHFRSKNNIRSSFLFKLGTDVLCYVENYKYLGVVLDESLDYEKTAKILADSAGRALGSIINKFRQLKNMGFKTFSALYNACVVPVNDYCTGIWGAGKLLVSETCQNRAGRFFLGTHKYTSNLAVNGDIGWEFCTVRRKIEILRFWNRCVNFDNDRLTKCIFMFDYNRCIRNWCADVKKIITDIDRLECFNNLLPVNLEYAKMCLHDMECLLWQDKCKNKPKLRSYIFMKKTYETEKYVKLNLPRSKRSIIAQFRTGTLPLQIETGRFRNLSIEERICPLCKTSVEDEIHFVFYCNALKNQRIDFLNDILLICNDFSQFNEEQKLAKIMSSELIQITINYVHKIFTARQCLLYK